MPGWAISNFGGELPLMDERLLKDGQATAAWNTDLDAGRLEGLPAPELVRDMTAVPGVVQRAYRFPGPTVGDPDAWLPLPSPFSSVVRSPLANDTLHRIYWTNPGEGAFWSTYARIIAGLPPYRLGFLPVEPYWVPVVVVSGGTLPYEYLSHAEVVDAGINYTPGEVIDLIGGTTQAGYGVARVVVKQTMVVVANLISGGTGGLDGEQVIYGTTGTGSRFGCKCVIVGGVVVGLGETVWHGGYDTNPTNPAVEPMTGAGLVGCTVELVLGVYFVFPWYNGGYQVPPANPVSTLSAGPGTGCTLRVDYLTAATAPLVARSYLFTYVDEYGQESSPSVPSAVVEGPSDGTWTVYGISNVPPVDFSGDVYPIVNKVRIYRTVTGNTTGAQFYAITDIVIPPGVDPSLGWVDTSLDTEIVNNAVLETAGWASPLPNLDGLMSLPGGMMVGFTGNTLHFCEPNRPHTWPASYDQSVNYPIVGLGVWNNTLVVLTAGFPSTGSGSTPANFTLQQVQVSEPCIARGSIVADILGVYYSSPNGLVMLNYFGMTVQTQALVSRRDWLVDFAADQIIAARHRAQYLAINMLGAGFMIDFAEARKGITHLNTFSNAVCIWNDVYSADAYIMAAKKVYRWDSPNAPPLMWRWRSKKFSLPAPITLGACQIDVGDEVLNPPPTVPPPMGNGDPSLVLPPGVNAVFRLYANDILIVEKRLTTPLEIFRLPSGFKAFDWQFEIVSWVPVSTVELARTMKELKGV